jgi:hypothetical protein
MKAPHFLIGTLGIILILILVAALLLKKTPDGENVDTHTQDETSISFPMGEPVSIPRDSPTLTLTDNTNEPIVTRNFMRESFTVEDPANPGYYFIEDRESSTSVGEDRQPPFVIGFMPSTSYFNVVLLKKPLSISRANAENFLTKALDLTQTELCELNYTVSVPYNIDNTYTGQVFTFSTCPGSIELP